MRIRYEKITMQNIILLVDLFPNYDFILDGDMKELIIKEKVKN